MLIDKLTISRLKILRSSLEKYENDPRTMPDDVRVEFALITAVIFKDFRTFANVGMQLLGFDITEMQDDIADYMQNGPKKRMVQAQRGEAKSTLAALYAVWRLIQDQRLRILVVSAGEKQASEVATLIIRIIETWPLLCWLKADKTAGDRTSYEAYDVHYSLKGLDKSPSVSCIGVTATMQGKRADLLIPDDIESTKNGLTQVMRDHLLTVSRDFAAICTHGDTLYLGTPQTKDSIYKTLPARGFDVKIWTGRIPSEEEEEYYGEQLAPYIKTLIDRGYKRTGFGIDGTLGQSTDTGRYSEEDLLEKELDFGPEGFQLQFMLNTSLSDSARTKIKLSDVIVYNGNTDTAPDTFGWSDDRRYQLVDVPHMIHGEKLYNAAYTGEQFLKYAQKCMIVDPSGCGGDEMSYAAGGTASSYIHLFELGGLQGGVSTENIDIIIDKCVDMNIPEIQIESNMGHGTVELLFINRLKERNIRLIGITSVYNTTQKERRIIDTVSPVTRRHRLVIHQRAIDEDTATCTKYPIDRRSQYSGLYQIANMTYDRGCLAKDDRADALSMLVHRLSKHLVEDEKVAAERAQAAELKAFYDNPLDMPERYLDKHSNKKRSYSDKRYLRDKIKRTIRRNRHGFY